MPNLSVHALSTGHITLPERFFVLPNDEQVKRSVPSLSFLIQHHSQSTDRVTRILFDLGLRRDLSLYPPELAQHCASRQPISTKPDVLESLNVGGLTAGDIDYVIFSHVHYDHIGYPRDFENTRTKFVIGPGSSELLNGVVKLHGTHSIFEREMFPIDRTIELPPTSRSNHESNTTSLNLHAWRSLSPFEHALDLFPEDPGAAYIISAPGHIPGHLNLLARISSSSSSDHCSTPSSVKSTPVKYVLLAGDACHDTRLFHGTHSIATWTDLQGHQCCIHADIPTALDTIARLRHVSQHGINLKPASSSDRVSNPDNINQEAKTMTKAEVEVVFAHNWEWELDAQKRGRFWPGRL